MQENIQPDQRSTSAAPSRWWGLVCVLAGFVVALGVGQFERVEVAEAAGQSVTVVLTLAMFLWHQRQQVWFCYFLGAAAIVHVAAVCLVPWPTHQLAKGDMLVGIADFIVMMGLALLVQRFARRAG